MVVVGLRKVGEQVETKVENGPKVRLTINMDKKSHLSKHEP